MICCKSCAFFAACYIFQRIAAIIAQLSKLDLWCKGLAVKVDNQCSEQRTVSDGWAKLPHRCDAKCALANCAQAPPRCPSKTARAYAAAVPGECAIVEGATMTWQSSMRSSPRRPAASLEPTVTTGCTYCFCFLSDLLHAFKSIGGLHCWHEAWHSKLHNACVLWLLTPSQHRLT